MIWRDGASYIGGLDHFSEEVKFCSRGGDVKRRGQNVPGLVGIACVLYSTGGAPSPFLLAVEANFRATGKDLEKSLDSGADSTGVDGREVHEAVGQDQSLVCGKLACHAPHEWQTG